jgi:hypothetical protein
MLLARLPMTMHCFEPKLIAAMQLKSPVLGYFEHSQTNAQDLNPPLWENVVQQNGDDAMQSSYIAPSMGLAVMSRANTTADEAALLR